MLLRQVLSALRAANGGPHSPLSLLATAPSWAQQHLQHLQQQQQCAATTTSSSSNSSGGRSGSRLPPDATPQGGDDYFWIPQPGADGPVPPASVGQRRASGRLESALESLLLGDAVLREALVERHGFSIHRLQLSKDRRRLHVLWDAHAGAAPACEAALQRNAFRLRRQLAALLQTKHTPFLDFRHDHLPPLQAAVAEAMERVEQELAADEAAAAAGAAAAAPAAAGRSSGGLDPAAVEAAIARLEVLTAPRQQPQEQQPGTESDEDWDEREEGEEGEEEEEGWEAEEQLLRLLQQQLEQQDSAGSNEEGQTGASQQRGLPTEPQKQQVV